MEYILYSIIVLLILLIISVLFLIKKNKGSNDDYSSLKADLNHELLVFKHDLTNAVKDDLLNLNSMTNKSLTEVSNRMQDGMLTNFKETSQSFTEVSKQLVSISETQKNLNALSEEITNLQLILTDKKSRGTFGEVELYSVLKSAYGLNSKAYETQYKLSNGYIADAIIFAANPLDKVAIDSKFPLENYLKMYDENLTKSQQQVASNQFVRDVKKHIDDIKNKYIIKGETADMAYLFIPAEAIFSEIYGKYEDIIQYGYDAKVFLVSQTTLMAYITALKAIYLSVEQNEKIDQIQLEFNKLALEFERFESRFQSVYNDFRKTNNDMRDLDITANKIINRFKEIEKVQLDEEDKYE